MPNAILCPVDFSVPSAAALRHAARWARCGNARLIALHAHWFEAPLYFTGSRIAELREEFRASLDEARRMLSDFVAGTLGPDAPPIETKVVEGLPVDVIRAEVETSGADLVVMGTHGRSGFNAWMLGSVTERALREVAAPLLAVRSGPAGEIRHVLCPVSDTAASHAALAAAVEIAACRNASVTALHVREPGGVGAIADLCAWIGPERRARCDIRELIVQGHASEEVVRAAAEGAYDLLVVGAARRKFFGGMALGAVTTRAVRHAPCPVLSVPAAAAGARV